MRVCGSKVDFDSLRLFSTPILEGLESSGTKVFMDEPIVSRLCVKERKNDR